LIMVCFNKFRLGFFICAIGFFRVFLFHEIFR